MFYPINLKLEKKTCLVVGGGKTAERKILRLLAAGADVTVVAPEISDEIKKLGETEQLRIEQREAQVKDVAGKLLVICATPDEKLNRDICAAAKAENALVNMAAPPLELSDFDLPAAADFGDLLVTYSTSSKCPELSRQLRQRYFGELDCYGRWLEILAPYRAGLKKRLGSSKACTEFWRRALNAEVMDLVAEGKLEDAEERIVNALGCLRSES